VRELDRAWRCLPEEAPTLAPRYAQLLAFEDRDWVAALRMLARALQFGPDPELEALSVRGELRLGNFREARQRLEETLGRFCVAPGDLLSAVAWQAVCDGRLAAAGWVGLTANLEFVWQLRSGLDASAMRIRVAGRDLPAASARTVRASPDRIFCWKPPEELAGERFDFVAGGVPLAGSGGSARPDFALDGRSDAAGQALSGWARLGWAPAQPLELCIEDDDGQRAWVRTRAPSDAQHRWPFALDLRRSALGGGRLRISARLPDARLQALPDSPLLLEAAVRLPASDRHTARRWAAVSRTRRAPRPGGRRPASIDVIVPVYRAREETLACLQSVLATIGAPAGRAPARAAQGTRAVAQLTGQLTAQLIAQLIVVDDASDDPALAAALDGLAAAGRILLLRNESNQGFVASVNRALALRPTHDAVLLNSDALVYGNWLERLRAAAYREPSVGTVTPFTNEGSIASYPDGMEHVTAGQAAALGAIAAEVHDGASVEIPVGVGHCLYLRRDCLRDVGAFDQAAFGTGYGEETDFALRARVHGWTHRLAADVFVFHAGGRSFAARRAALLDRSQRLLNLRHPGYDEFIGSYLAADPLQGLRRELCSVHHAGLDRRSRQVRGPAMPRASRPGPVPARAQAGRGRGAAQGRTVDRCAGAAEPSLRDSGRAGGVAAVPARTSHRSHRTAALSRP
jgi:GT2 family glycosyltransferase